MAAGLKIERPGQFALFHAPSVFVMRAAHEEGPSRRRAVNWAQITRGQAGATAVCGSVRLWAGEGVSLRRVCLTASVSALANTALSIIPTNPA